MRVPVEFIDEISTEGFTKYINAFKEYVNTNGGPLNAGLKAYGDYSGKDVVAETQKGNLICHLPRSELLTFLINKISDQTIEDIQRNE